MFFVDFNSSTWTDPWFRKLSVHAKLLLIYLETNNHKSHAGLYALDRETMAFETGLTAEEVEQSLEALYPRVEFDYQQELVWIADHAKNQFMRKGNISPKMVINIDKCLRGLPEGHPFIGEFLKKYHTLPIEYPYPIQESGYHPGGGEGKGKEKDAGKGGDKGGNGINPDIGSICSPASKGWKEDAYADGKKYSRGGNA